MDVNTVTLIDEYFMNLDNHIRFFDLTSTNKQKTGLLLAADMLASVTDTPVSLQHLSIVTIQAFHWSSLHLLKPAIFMRKEKME